MIEQSRRSFLIGSAVSLLAAPAIVRIGSIMPVKAINWWAGPPWMGDIKFFAENGDVIPRMWTGTGWLTHPEFEDKWEYAEMIPSSNTLIVSPGGRAKGENLIQETPYVRKIG